MKKNIVSNFWEKRSPKQQLRLAVAGALLYTLALFCIGHFYLKMSFKESCAFAGVGYVVTTLAVQWIMINITDIL